MGRLTEWLESVRLSRRELLRVGSIGAAGLTGTAALAGMRTGL